MPSIVSRRSASTGLPTPRELSALTGDRDRVIDLIRIMSLAVVVAGHSIMLTVDVTDDSIHLGNTLGDVPALQPATWLLQVLPLFFFAGAAAATRGWTSRGDGATPTAGQCLVARTQRLMRPVFWYLGAVAAVYAVLSGTGATVAADVVARLGVQLLWFLGAYVLVLAAVPLLRSVEMLRALTADRDAIGLPGHGPAFTDVAASATRVEALSMVGGIVLVNLFWASCAILGVGIVFTAFPWLALAVKIAGAGYLIWFGGRLIANASATRLVVRA